MTYLGEKHTAVVGWGNLLITLNGTKEVFLQGDDSNSLRADIEALDEIQYPSGPFPNYAAHLDALLDQYDTID